MTFAMRRKLLVMGAGLGALLRVSAPALARAGANDDGKRAAEGARAATAVTQVFGDGIKLVAVALEYAAPVDGARLAAGMFRVPGRTVTGVFASTSAAPADRAARGPFVIVTLSADDAGAALARKRPSPGGSGPGGPGGAGGPGKAGTVPVFDTAYQPAAAEVVQAGAVALADGTRVPSPAAALATGAVLNQVVDEFRQLTFTDPDSGKLLRYNLFVPRGHDAAKSYPLVLFMHDAGATSDVTRSTLLQGLGAVAWADPREQARRPCFVLAPQYAEIIADDDSTTSAALDTTVALVHALTREYGIDRKRLYATGQSGGCMMAIAMDIKYPGLFAASFLVAGQWAPELTRPLARQKLWILVSQDDDKAWPGQNAIAAVLEREGARIARATWDGTWNAERMRAAFERIDRERAPINLVSFAKGSVIPPGQSAAGASGHRNTWRLAYGIEPIREWLFRQHG